MRAQTRPFTVEKKKSRATPARRQAVSLFRVDRVTLDLSHEPTALAVADRLLGTIGAHVRHVA